eukprot:TRINITY_DN55964_c0_g1_i1.p1 TRINITY_DN55964_c0_g1~~TRINITY_DN55964_c0_g1_i1.p1  ORF type:complete len:777 (+),score=119.75 TRINITY_DN55964_c0_g1_i1:197-2527(+)
MTIYYDPQQPIITAALRFQHSSLGFVMRRVDFWIFLSFHCLLVLLFVTDTVDPSDLPVLPWKTTTMIQFFMTCFIIFYTQRCFTRFMKLYVMCTSLLDSVLLFVFELSVSFGSPKLERHRTLATKYVLSATYIVFMSFTGGHPSRTEWKELVHKGHLTNQEMDVLSEYPGNVTFVLFNWAMQIAQQALSIEEIFWHRPEEFGGTRQQQISHPYNRLDAHVISFLATAEEIGHLVAQPIPFQYYHLMILVLVMNFFLMGYLLALLKMLATIPMFAVFLLVFLGLGELATQLADPFGRDEVDFPVPQFLNYAFDNAICLLEAFNRMDKQALFASVKKARGFTTDHLRRRFDPNLLYGKTLNMSKRAECHWQNLSPLSQLDSSEQNVLAYIRTVMRTNFSKEHEAGAATLEAGARDQASQATLEELVKAREAAEQELRETMAEVERLEQLANRRDLLGVDYYTNKFIGRQGVADNVAGARELPGTEPSSASKQQIVGRDSAEVSASGPHKGPGPGPLKPSELSAVLRSNSATGPPVVAGTQEPPSADLHRVGTAVDGAGAPSARAQPAKSDCFEKARADIRRALESTINDVSSASGASAARPPSTAKTKSAPPSSRSARDAVSAQGLGDRREQNGHQAKADGLQSLVELRPRRPCSAPGHEDSDTSGDYRPHAELFPNNRPIRSVSGGGNDAVDAGRAIQDDDTLGIDADVRGGDLKVDFETALAQIRHARDATRDLCERDGHGGGEGRGRGSSFGSPSPVSLQPASTGPSPVRLGRLR